MMGEEARLAGPQWCQDASVRAVQATGQGPLCLYATEDGRGWIWRRYQALALIVEGVRYPFSGVRLEPAP